MPRSRTLVVALLAIGIIATSSYIIMQSGLFSSNTEVAATAGSLAPIIQSITPASGGPGTAVTITGENFSNSALITLAGYPMTEATVETPFGSTGSSMTAQPEAQISSSQIVFTIPASFTVSGTTHDLSSGTYPVTISTSQGSSQNVCFNYVAPSGPLLNAIPHTSCTTTPSTTAPSSSTIILSYTLKNGSTDAATNGQVTILQKFLVADGYLNIAQTQTGYGTFGGYTQSALQAFQKAKGIPQSGETDAATIAAIETATTPTSTPPSPQNPLDRPPSPGALPVITITYVLQNGSTDATTQGQVTLLQQFLVADGYLNIAQTQTGYGTFGGYTQSALEAFQKANNLPQTGKTDNATDAAITAAGLNSGASVPLNPNPPATPSPVGSTIATPANAIPLGGYYGAQAGNRYLVAIDPLDDPTKPGELCGIVGNFYNGGCIPNLGTYMLNFLNQNPIAYATLLPGQSTTTSVAFLETDTAPTPMSISLSGLPAGVTASFPNGTSCNPIKVDGYDAVCSGLPGMNIAFTATNSVQPGTYHVIVNTTPNLPQFAYNGAGYGGVHPGTGSSPAFEYAPGVNDSPFTISLYVPGAQGPGATITSDPAAWTPSVNIVQNGTASATFGFMFTQSPVSIPKITATFSGLPAGVTVSYPGGSNSCAPTNTLANGLYSGRCTKPLTPTFTATNTAKPGTYTVKVNTAPSTLVQSPAITFTLVVAPSTANITPDPNIWPVNGVKVDQGTVANANFSYVFSDSATLPAKITTTFSGIPAGVTVSYPYPPKNTCVPDNTQTDGLYSGDCSNNPIVANFTAGPNAKIGTYTIKVVTTPAYLKQENPITFQLVVGPPSKFILVVPGLGMDPAWLQPDGTITPFPEVQNGATVSQYPPVTFEKDSKPLMGPNDVIQNFFYNGFTDLNAVSATQLDNQIEQWVVQEGGVKDQVDVIDVSLGDQIVRTAVLAAVNNPGLYPDAIAFWQKAKIYSVGGIIGGADPSAWFTYFPLMANLNATTTRFAELNPNGPAQMALYGAQEDTLFKNSTAEYHTFTVGPTSGYYPLADTMLTGVWGCYDPDIIARTSNCISQFQKNYLQGRSKDAIEYYVVPPTHDPSGIPIYTAAHFRSTGAIAKPLVGFDTSYLTYSYYMANIGTVKTPKYQKTAYISGVSLDHLMHVYLLSYPPLEQLLFKDVFGS